MRRDADRDIDRDREREIVRERSDTRIERKGDVGDKNPREGNPNPWENVAPDETDDDD